jgi:monoamine oxidase
MVFRGQAGGRSITLTNPQKYVYFQGYVIIGKFFEFGIYQSNQTIAQFFLRGKSGHSL